MTTIPNDKWTNPMDDYFIIKVDSRPDGFYTGLHAWLHEHCTGHWVTTATRVGFELEQDAVLFRLSYK